MPLTFLYKINKSMTLDKFVTARSIIIRDHQIMCVHMPAICYTARGHKFKLWISDCGLGLKYFDPKKPEWSRPSMRIFSDQNTLKMTPRWKIKT
ncbi:MAG: hypothetical protein A3F17_08805 [Gammaproteobacteria bacterium RIFCSPHIGHO2_12_FULL_41_15]|nr:MAG: hypothetical protein A3F17_08805 [Gammaproteobacteria bacterium RIFCSPHIGHO2_12_FULL_41_15]